MTNTPLFTRCFHYCTAIAMLSSHADRRNAFVLERFWQFFRGVPPDSELEDAQIGPTCKKSTSSLNVLVTDTHNVQTKARRKPKQPHFADNSGVTPDLDTVHLTCCWCDTLLCSYCFGMILSFYSFKLSSHSGFWPILTIPIRCFRTATLLRLQLLLQEWVAKKVLVYSRQTLFCGNSLQWKNLDKNGVWKTILSSSFHGVV